jgi:hypothetical protein
MFPNDVIARERIADRLREGEHERLGRQAAEARALARRAKIRGALNLVAGHWALARRRRVARPA